MATTLVDAPPARPGAATLDASWVCFPATWSIYTALLDARGDRNRPRYVYLDGRMTVVSPGHLHESTLTRITALVQEILVGLSIACHPSGQVTLKKSAESREGVEADASYYLTNIDRVLGSRDIVMGVDPAPDLVIEVVVSHPEQDALDAYRRFGVREVWVCKGSSLAFLVLGADGTYATSPRSASLPWLSSEELAFWLYRQDQPDEIRLLKLFRGWVETTLLPRQRVDQP